MRLSAWAALLTLLAPLRAQETPHPNRVAWLSVFPEPLPEGATQFTLETTSQFLRPDRRDNADDNIHARLQGEEWGLVSDLAAEAGPGSFNLRSRLTYRSAGIASQLIKNWHNILGVSQGGRDSEPTFNEDYHLDAHGTTVFDLQSPRLQLQGLDLGYVVPWGDARNGGRAGATVQVSTGHLRELQSSDGTNFLAGAAAWRTFGKWHTWAQAEDVWISLPEHSPLREVVSRGQFWRAYAGVRYQGTGSGILSGLGLDLSVTWTETPYRTGLVRIDKYGLQQTWTFLHTRLPRWRFGFMEEAGTFTNPDLTAFLAFRP